ncbi:MAG: type II toxin-antitoxin system VapC family toxin [Actinobacteria bacterium]|nr:type II toxin-antitoxin system VapC family toxin [Actinomycetota bacterium]
MGDVADGPVVDTDVLIDYLRGSGPGAELLAHLGRGGYRVTAVSAFELALGAAHRLDPRPVQALLDAPTLALTPRGGLLGGAALARLRGDGRGIDVRDALQAGVCLDADAPLVTRNMRRFERVPGLRVVRPGDWR